MKPSGPSVPPGRPSADSKKQLRAEERRRTARSRAVQELIYTKLLMPGLGAACEAFLKTVAGKNRAADIKNVRWLLDLAVDYGKQGATSEKMEEKVAEKLGFFQDIAQNEGLSREKRVLDDDAAGSPSGAAPTPISAHADDPGASGGGSATGS